jgi:hypothetical protein
VDDDAKVTYGEASFDDLFTCIKTIKGTPVNTEILCIHDIDGREGVKYEIRFTTKDFYVTYIDICYDTSYNIPISTTHKIYGKGNKTSKILLHYQYYYN